MNKQRIAIAIAVAVAVFLIASWLYFIWVGTKEPSVERFKPVENPTVSINYSALKQRLLTEPELVQRVIVEKDSLGEPTAIVLLMKSSTGIADLKAELPSKGTETEIRVFAEKHKIEYAAERQLPPEASASSTGSTLLAFLPQIIMMLFFGAIVYFMWKQHQNTNGNSKNNLRKSKFQLIEKGKVNVCFDDVEGCPEAKEELKDIVDYLKDPSHLEKLGGKVTKGVLLIGPPGTGKTLIARAIAGEAQVAFLSGGGSGFIEMYVGLGAARVRDLFEEARKHKPCIIFIDEIDSVGRARSSGGNSGDSEQDQTLNQILQEMDGFEGREGIIVIAATNRVDILDKAILRPGRFDLHVTMPLPDINGRENIFKVHTRNKPLDEGINGNLIAKQTFGYSGADIAGMVNQGALVAARRIRNEKAKLLKKGLSSEEIERTVPFVITMEDLTEGADRVKMGIRSDSRKLAISRQEMINTAVHELGHALVGEYHYRRGLGGDPIVKITIIPRSQALGVTMSHPEIDRVSWTRENLLARIRMAFAGRIAQVRILNTVDGGATNDFEQAYSIAHSMVAQYGMSTLGYISVGGQSSSPFPGYSSPQGGPGVSPELSNKIDIEIARILEECRIEAEQIVDKYKAIIERTTPILLDRETILRPEWLEALEVTDFPPLPAEGGHDFEDGLELAPVKHGLPGWAISSKNIHKR